MIKYLGSKRALLPNLLQVITSLEEGPTTAMDLFSGTSRVGHCLKGAGFAVTSNDHNAYAHTLATCYVQADREKHEEAAQKLISELNSLAGSPGYFTETFCEKSRFFQPKNGARVDAIREEIERKGLDPELKAVVLTSLIEAADRVDSTVGVQMAYLKKWAPRAEKDMEMRVPFLLPRAKAGKGRAVQMEALDAVTSHAADICYMDPPYNQHKYLGNYHIWESLVLWDKPEVYGVACKRVDCKDRKSPFNSKPNAKEALSQVIRLCSSRHLVVSFNNEGYLSREDIEEMLQVYPYQKVIEFEHSRYVGSKTGIYSPSGNKVGKVSHTRNIEYVYVASQEEQAIATVPYE